MISALNKFRRSLTNRLLLVFLITSLLMTALIVQMLIRGFSAQWQTNMRPHLMQYLDYVNSDLGDPPSVEKADELANRLGINIYIQGENLNYTSTGSPLQVSDLEFESRGLRHWRRHSKNSGNNPTDQRKISFGEHDDRSVLRVSIGDYDVYYELRHRGKRDHRDDVITKTLLGILLLLGICYLVIRRMLRPVQDIKLGVKRMGEGELDYRVPVKTNNDLGELAGSINIMATDIERMLDAKQQLLLGVSHELRSPLTRATIATELLDESNNKNRIQEDLLEMESLITEILETERMNVHHAAINRSPVAIKALVDQVLQDLSAEKISPVIDPDLSDPELSNLELDEPRVTLLLRNLISNALRHGGNASTPPKVEIKKDKNNLYIIVSDSGPGISAEHISQVTQPFYRVDPSRTRATGGFGIGLYLSKLIAEAHRGDLSIESKLGTGTTVSVRLAL